MIEKDLLEIVVCPRDRQPLEAGAPELLARLNALVARGELKNHAGQVLQAPLEEILVRADGRVAYPVTEGIPMLLAEEGIDLPGAA